MTATDHISFDEISGSTRTPGAYIEFNARLAVRNLPGNPQSLRLVGQKLATAVAQVGTPYKYFSAADAADLFGYGSHLHAMTVAALTANPYVQICALAVPDPTGGTAAQGTFTLAGAAARCSLVVKVGHRQMRVAVDAGMAAADVAADLRAELASHPELPVTASSAAGVVTVDAVHPGEAGNLIKLSAWIEGASGLTVTVGPMTGGTGTPALDASLAMVQNAGDNILSMPYTDAASLVSLRNHLDFVSNGIEQRGALASVATAGTYGEAVAVSAGMGARRVSPVWLWGTNSLPWEVAAGYGSVMAFEEDPARPLNHLEIKGIHAPDPAYRIGRNEIEGCLHNGVTPLVVGPAERVQIVRAISAYTVNPQGMSDPAWLDITTPRTLDYVRYAVRQRWLLRFPREKASPRVLGKIRSETIAVLRQIEEMEIIHDVDAYTVPGLQVVESGQEAGRVNVRIPVRIVSGLHVIAAVIDLII